MNLSDLSSAMEQIAPTRYAESWDNVGLLVGDPAQRLSRLLLTIDYTPEVAAEAVRLRCDAVLAYHPPIFQGLKRIAADSVVHHAIRHGIGIYSPHTALDAADGGTNDVLADALGLVDLRPLKPAEPKSTQYKLVVFVPPTAVEKVSDVLFQAGAGRIGNYSRCSFRSAGTGTFFGEEGANPTVGSAGQMETADELRLETVVPIKKLDAVLAALRSAHPYEEPAFDLVTLAAPPEGRGVGRVGRLPAPASQASVAARLKKALGLPHLLLSSPRKPRPVRTVAICAGAGGDFLDAALAAKADLYLTGEIRHHDALRAAREGLSVLLTLHTNSERPALPPLARRLRQLLPGLKTAISRQDRDPFGFI